MADKEVPQSVKALAAELQTLAEGITAETFLHDIGKGAQLARRLDKDAAAQLSDLALGGRVPPDRLFYARGVLEGVAAAALLDGVSSTGVSPSSVFYVSSVAHSTAISAATAALTQLDATLAQSEVPADVRAEVEAFRRDAEAGADKPTLLDRASKLAARLKEFPALGLAVLEVVKHFL